MMMMMTMSKNAKETVTSFHPGDICTTRFSGCMRYCHDGRTQNDAAELSYGEPVLVVSVFENKFNPYYAEWDVIVVSPRGAVGCVYSSLLSTIWQR